MADIIKLRRDTKANWESVNPILAEGEAGVESDTRRIKFGNGSSHWNDLGYAIPYPDSGEMEEYRVIEVNHGTEDTTYELPPNQYHIWGEVTSLNLTLASGESGYVKDYMFEFTSGSTATTLTLPSAVKWALTPVIGMNMRYQVSIMNNIALIVGASNVSE